MKRYTRASVIEYLPPSGLQPHPINAEIYGSDSFEDLVESVGRLGVIQPFTVCHRSHFASGTVIISGHRRWRAAMAAGLPDVPCLAVTFANALDEEESIIEHNRTRIKTGQQLFNEGIRQERIEAEKARKRQEATVPQEGQKGFQSVNVKENFPAHSIGQTRDIVAQKIGLGSGRQWDKLKEVGEKKPELLAEIKPGGISLNAAYTDVKRTDNAARREQEREVDRQFVAAIGGPNTERCYACIAIDPPWDWADEGDVDQLGRAKPPYATMPLAEIVALPVVALSLSDAHIYLWITNRSLPKGFELLDHWGFRYITCLTWVKPSFGMGNYFRGSTEHVIFGVKGSLPLLTHDLPTHFAAPRPRGHSTKPQEFFEIVSRASPGPRLEMFARAKRDGWDSWGNLS